MSDPRNTSDTRTTLAATQASRRASLPEQISDSPLRTALLEGLRERNATLDAIFYDVGTISPAEATRIAPHLAAEGAIVVVPPSGEGELALCRSVEDFVAYAPDVDVLAVAGVGSSALGTAAFARNIADAIGRPVAGVVSGYGLSDLLTEAAGGFLWFGLLNHLRHCFEAFDRMTESGFVAEPPRSASTVSPARRSKDTQTVVALLEHPALDIRMMSGHSKGNLVISEALFQIRHWDRPRLLQLAQEATIVTIGACIAMPRQMERVIDIMGAWDWFGGLNSRPSIRADIEVPGAWHHTNTELPAHLPVTATIRQALQSPRWAAAARPKPGARPTGAARPVLRSV